MLIRAEVLVARADLEAFRDLTAQLATAMTAEPGIIAYRWFTTADPLRFVVLEEHAAPDDVFDHSPAAGELLNRIACIAQLTQVQVHGDIDARLAAWVAHHPHATAHRPLQL